MPQSEPKKEPKSTFSLKEELNKDDILLLDMLRSPIETLKNRDILCDQVMVNHLNVARDDIMKRARAVFIEVGLKHDAIREDGTQGCQGCNGCQGCGSKHVMM